MKLLNNIFLIFIPFIIDFINNFTKCNLHLTLLGSCVTTICTNNRYFSRSVLGPFDMKTVFDLAGEEISLYPKVVYCGQQHFRSIRTVRRYTYGYDATAVEPTEFFNESMLTLLIIKTTKLNYR